MLKLQSQHFTIAKCNAVQLRIVDFSHAQVAILEPAVGEVNARQVGFRKIAMTEQAVFVASFFYRTKAVIGFFVGLIVVEVHVELFISQIYKKVLTDQCAYTQFQEYI